MVTQNTVLNGGSNTATPFKTILADPPWDVQQKGRLGAASHYDLMTLDAIKAMPVADMAAEDAHLWLWVTNATLEEGFQVIRAWGFTPRSPLTWIKPRIGLGQYLRNSTEHLLFGTRGNAPVNFRAQPTWGFYPLREHSVKPDEQYAVIERVSDGPYLELFGRQSRPGWTVWGNEATKFDRSDELPTGHIPHQSALPLEA